MDPCLPLPLPTQCHSLDTISLNSLAVLSSISFIFFNYKVNLLFLDFSVSDNCLQTGVGSPVACLHPLFRFLSHPNPPNLMKNIVHYKSSWSYDYNFFLVQLLIFLESRTTCYFFIFLIWDVSVIALTPIS